jgi:hypothetical protein
LYNRYAPRQIGRQGQIYDESILPEGYFCDLIINRFHIKIKINLQQN